MSELTKQQKLENIIKWSAEYQITAYEIGENTPLNTSGVSRILKGKVENPNDYTVNTIYNYINEKIFYKNSDNKTDGRANEPSNVSYQKQTAEDYLIEIRDLHKEMQTYIKEIVKLQNLLSRNNIEFENIFEKNN